LKRKMETGKSDKKTGIGSFLKYRENNLSGSEKNDFEKELQRDPFALEADEGLSELETGRIKADMDELNKRLDRRTSRSRRIVLYRIAAGVALLAALSSVYLLLNRKPEALQQAPAEKIALAEPKAEEKTADKISLTKADKPGKISEEKNVKTVTQPSAPETMAKSEPVVSKKEEKDKTKQDDSLRFILVQEEKKPEVSDKAAGAASVAMSRSLVPEMRNNEIKGTIKSADDGSPIPGAIVTLKGTSIGTLSDASGNYRLTVPEKKNISVVASFIGMVSREVQVTGDSVLNITLDPSLQGLSEVVVTGYGVRKSDETGAIGESTLAEPEGGMAKFQDFIKKNIRYPLETRMEDKQVVVLAFKIRLNGYPDSIIVLRSPGKPFTDEAIRLLKEGPLWKPATVDGKAVENNARVRIVFK
jgi:outer membrane biosynthesis protein TonB